MKEKEGEEEEGKKETSGCVQREGDRQGNLCAERELMAKRGGDGGERGRGKEDEGGM